MQLQLASCAVVPMFKPKLCQEGLFASFLGVLQELCVSPLVSQQRMISCHADAYETM